MTPALPLAQMALNRWALLLVNRPRHLSHWFKCFQFFDASLNVARQNRDLAPSWRASAFKRYIARVYWFFVIRLIGLIWLLGIPFKVSEWRIIRYTNTPQCVKPVGTVIWVKLIQITLNKEITHG